MTTRFENTPLAQFTRAPWLTAIGTLLGYGIILLGMFVLLFLIPWLLFIPF